MDLVAALKALGVLLAGIAGWLLLAVAALDVLFRIAAPRGERLPAAVGASAPRLSTASAAMRSADSRSGR